MRVGAFDTLILFDPAGIFDPEIPTSHFANYYTDCARFDSFNEVPESRFAIAELQENEETWLTGSDGFKLKDTRYKRIDEAALSAKMPNIYRAFTGNV